MAQLENQETGQTIAPAGNGVPGVLRIDRIDLVVADLDAAQSFYRAALGFSTAGRVAWAGEAFSALNGLTSARAQAAIMHLGGETLALVHFATGDHPYPEPRSANDPWFQHFAVAVSDMDAAFRRLSRYGGHPISRAGPQRLPPSTGGVTAYKFRDPDGHPLELSLAPNGPWAEHAQAAAGPTLGIDHAARVVADLAASLRFYTEALGLRPGPPAVNQGPAQARLDGLDDPVLDIATLSTRLAGPHLELLHYRQPRSEQPCRRLGVDKIAATRLVMTCDGLDVVASRALAAGGTPVSAAVVDTPPARRLLLRDPDGHLLELVDSMT